MSVRRKASELAQIDSVSAANDIGKCETCAIRNRAVCGALSDSELVELNKIATTRHFQAGQVIMSHDEPTEFFANIVSGTVKLTNLLPDGRQQIVGLQFPPDFLGRTYGARMPYFAEAATDVELCWFPRKRFEDMLTGFPGLENRLFKNTLDQLDAAREWMMLLGRKTAREKVASFLLVLATRARNIGCAHSLAPETVRFTLPLTRSDIADYLGLTFETVSRQITHLKMQGTIGVTSAREIIVPDLDALAKAGGVNVADVI